MWFERLTGFREQSPAQVRENLVVEGEMLRSLVNGQAHACGTLEIPSLALLRERSAALAMGGGPLRLGQVVADVRDLHRDPANAGAVFQVASQFNLLEMVGPDVRPEDGVERYEYDRTQGPACAVACGAGTIYRNYFVPVDGKPGQEGDRQVDCLADLGRELGNRDGVLWEMRNGYALASRQGLEHIASRLAAADPGEMEHLRGLLRVGVQWDAEVCLPGMPRPGHRVTQVYCSALPVAYSGHPAELWEPFARLVLEASYEAVLRVALLNRSRHEGAPLYLTLIGGGVFGNRDAWITAAMARAMDLLRDSGLEVLVVSHGSLRPAISALVEQWAAAPA